MNETAPKKGSIKIQIGIYLLSLSMMGAIGIISCLATINAHFPDASQTFVTGLMSFVTIGAIIATLISAAISDRVSKKWFTVVGMIIWLIGGLLPFFLDNLNAILACRLLFGVGVGIIQGMNASLVAENFDGHARTAIMGRLFGIQMIGIMIMTAISSYLATLEWNMAFLVHLIGVVSLIGLLFLIPSTPPKTAEERAAEKAARQASGQKLINAELIGWWIMMMVFFIFGQVFSSNVSFLMEELGMGNSIVAGFSLIGMAIGGLIISPFFGGLDRKLKNASPFLGFAFRIAAYLLMAFCHGSVAVCIIGAILQGFGVTYCMSVLTDKASNAVAPLFMGMALSVVSLLQNIGQTLSPYIMNPTGFALGAALGITPNQGTYVLSSLGSLVLAVVFLIWGIINNKKKAGQYYRVHPEER